MKSKRVVVRMKPDWVEPYNLEGAKIPVVEVSNHPRFGVGTRLDWGFVRCVLRDGYTLLIHPK